MDLWVVAAAAGAGCIAKNLQNLSVDKKESVQGPVLKYPNNVHSESRNLLQQLRDKTCPLRRLARARARARERDDGCLDMENHAAAISDDALEKSGNLEDYITVYEDVDNSNFRVVNRGKLVRDRRYSVHPIRPLNSLGSYLDGCRDEVRRENGVSLKTTNTSSSSTSTQFESDEETWKLEKSSSNLELSGNTDGVSSRLSCSQGPETMLLFITGMTIGIVCATMSWKNEVDKLNKQLKQMDNLVQDLHEELDLKEMLMVKELRDEGERNKPMSIQEPVSSPDLNAKKMNELDSLMENDKNRENIELFSRIEAELQAELEMLEQNMKASALERISSVVEHDADIVQGDLKPIMVNGALESGNETGETTTNCSKPANYTVSPWELSLKLHELIESRLEKRIKELEIALGHSDNRLQVQRFSYSETEYSSTSTHQSPTENFTSYYFDAYKEQNGVFPRVTNKDQEEEYGEAGNKGIEQGKHSIDQIWNGEYDSISRHGVIMAEDRSTSFTSNEDSMSEDEGSDESEMLLIKKIIERRKSGSSFTLHID